MHALTNTAAGVASEARVAAELARCGLKIARPFWLDDEVDLLVFTEGLEFPLPVQVKTVQRGRDSKGRSFIQGLKKAYVERQPGLCLAIYHPGSDSIWFFAGPAKIRDAYRLQRAWPKHIPYEKIESSKLKEVRIGFNLDRDGSKDHEDYLVPRDNAAWLSKAIFDLAKDVKQSASQRAVYAAMFTTVAAEVESVDEEDIVELERDPYTTLEKLKKDTKSGGEPKPASKPPSKAR